MRVVEAVVRARVQDEDSRRLIDGARTRIADWLERGASFSATDQRRKRGPEKARSR